MSEQQIGFEIDGKFYELPLLGTFDMDENRIFKRQTGLNAEDAWLGLQDDGEMSFHELFRTDGFLESMVHIAYRREHPDIESHQIERMIGKLNRMELFASFVTSLSQEEEAPLQTSGSTSEPERSSPSEKLSRLPTSSSREETSGSSSETSSELPDAGPGSTGTIGSGGRSTSAPRGLAG